MGFSRDGSDYPQEKRKAEEKKKKKKKQGGGKGRLGRKHIFL
jgi:hypothetical protein